jgi:hypothetical protein
MMQTGPAMLPELDHLPQGRPIPWATLRVFMNIDRSVIWLSVTVNRQRELKDGAKAWFGVAHNCPPCASIM